MSTFYRRDNEPHPFVCICFILAWAVLGFFLWDTFIAVKEQLIGWAGALIGLVVYFGGVALVSCLILCLLLVAGASLIAALSE